MWLLLTPFLIYSVPLDHLAKEEVLKIAADSGKIELKGDTTVVLREVQFSGNDAVTREELTRLASPYLDQPFSQNNLSELLGRIKIVYRGKGYKHMVVNSWIEKHYDHYVLFIIIKEGRRDPERQR